MRDCGHGRIDQGEGETRFRLARSFGRLRCGFVVERRFPEEFDGARRGRQLRHELMNELRPLRSEGDSGRAVRRPELVVPACRPPHGKFGSPVSRTEHRIRTRGSSRALPPTAIGDIFHRTGSTLPGVCAIAPTSRQPDPDSAEAFLRYFRSFCAMRSRGRAGSITINAEATVTERRGKLPDFLPVEISKTLRCTFR